MNFKLTPVFLLIFACSMSAQAKMFKWVDEEGNTHFGDKIPDQYLAKEHKEINEQGVIVETHEEIKIETAEEKKKRLRAERVKKEAQAKAKEQAKQDRVLLDTYTTERDLTAARDARLDAVDSQLQLSKSITDDAKRKLDLTEKQITRLKASGKQVPENITAKLDGEAKQLKIYEELAASHLKRKQDITEQFETYIKRFRELKDRKKRIKDEREARRREALGL